MGHDLRTAGANLLATILGLDPKIAVGPALGAAIRKLVEHRQQVALDILLEEMAAGQINPADVPPESLAAPVYRYMRSAREGAARLNLRLLARLIADEFLYWADIIAFLRREEIVLIAELHRAATGPSNISPEIERAASQYRAGLAAIKTLIPIPLKDTDHYLATAGAVSRTGLIIMDVSTSGIVPRLSPLADKIIAMTSFEAALEREPTANKE